jgi:hypothetical protein
MHDLQLVGFTTDRRGLIYRTTGGAREHSFVVPITDELLALLSELADPAVVDEVASVEDVDAAALDTTDPEPVERPTSSLSVREIQARLRAGDDVAAVAADAGVDEEWIERFAPPVRAEQRRIIERALASHLTRPRAGESAVPLRRAVGMALAERGIAFTASGFEAAWSARLLGHDRWSVAFAYRHRGRARTATWVYDARDDELATGDRTGAQLGYVAGDARVDDAPEPTAEGVIGDPDAPSPIDAPAAPQGAGARAKAGAKRTKRATKKAGAKKRVAKKAGAEERPAKKAAAKKAAAKRRPATKAAVKKAAAKKRAAKKAAVKKAATKKRPAKKAAPRSCAKKAAPRRLRQEGCAQEGCAQEGGAQEGHVQEGGGEEGCAQEGGAQEARGRGRCCDGASGR